MRLRMTMLVQSKLPTHRKNSLTTWLLQRKRCPKPTVYLASILLSQAAYESNYVSSLLSVKYHNLYSLSAQPGQEHLLLKDNVYSKGKWQYQKVDFAVFKDWSSSMLAYLEGLRQGRWGESTYKEVAGTTSYKVAAEKLQAAGFNSDLDYAKHLISIVETYHLSKYDR